MHLRKSKKSIIYFFLLIMFGSINNINLRNIEINKIKINRMSMVLKIKKIELLPKRSLI